MVEDVFIFIFVIFIFFSSPTDTPVATATRTKTLNNKYPCDELAGVIFRLGRQMVEHDFVLFFFSVPALRIQQSSSDCYKKTENINYHVTKRARVIFHSGRQTVEEVFFFFSAPTDTAE